MNVFEKISSRYVDYMEYNLLYKIIEILGDDRIEYNRKINCYYTNKYVIRVTKKKATAKSLYEVDYDYIIKPPRKLASI